MRFRRVASSVWPETGARSRAAGRTHPSAASGAPRGGTERGRQVRRFLEAYERGDLAAAGRMVTEDFSVSLQDADGQPVTLRGFEAVRAFTARRDQALGRTVAWEILDVLTSEEQVAVVFRMIPASSGLDARQLALWGFRGDRIASCRVFGAPRQEQDAG